MKKRTGINIRKWCLEHEAYVSGKLSGTASSQDADDLLQIHSRKLAWLMHERLIHLIVLLITVILVLFSITLILFLPETLPGSLPMFVITFVLACFYVRHYFFLENTVQHWYELDTAIRELSDKKDEV